MSCLHNCACDAERVCNQQAGVHSYDEKVSRHGLLLRNICPRSRAVPDRGSWIPWASGPRCRWYRMTRWASLLRQSCSAARILLQIRT